MAISSQQLTIYLYSAHRAVIFAIAQVSCMSCHHIRHCISWKQLEIEVWFQKTPVGNGL